MSINMPPRQACCVFSRTLVLRPKSRTVPNFVLTLPQQRNASVFDYFRSKSKPAEQSKPMSVEEAMKGYKPPMEQQPEPGKLSDDSIFGKEEDASEEEADENSRRRRVLGSRGMMTMDEEAKVTILDPEPWTRVVWQRKRAIQAIKKRGRITRTEQLLKQERTYQYSSVFWKTSLKKIQPLARQIAGKTVEEALLQLRFSKKLPAVRIAQELKLARDEAIVGAGMGLGHIQAQKAEWEDYPAAEDHNSLQPAKLPEQALKSNDSVELAKLSEQETETRNGLEMAKVSEQEQEIEEEDELEPVVVQEKEVATTDKDGKTRHVKPSTIYIDQVWVNKGKHNYSLTYRARGRTNRLTHRHMSISFLLKEEKTRIRRNEERQQKLAKARPWVHHPDRNIPHQRQYIMW